MKIEIDMILHTIQDADNGETLIDSGHQSKNAIGFTTILKAILTKSQFDLWAGTCARTFTLSKKKQAVLQEHIDKHNGSVKKEPEEYRDPLDDIDLADLPFGSQSR